MTGDKPRNPSQNQKEPRNHDGTRPVSWKNWEPPSAQELFGAKNTLYQRWPQPDVEDSNAAVRHERCHKCKSMRPRAPRVRRGQPHFPGGRWDSGREESLGAENAGECHPRSGWHQSNEQGAQNEANDAGCLGDKCKIMRPRAPRVGRQVWETSGRQV